ncbi:MAG TPA: LytTR family DNA-binding domain-containing protein [Ferruginibacter sp.]|nr:LytTR family DNA-binding domain-containing protein [Ferruginibacter sp.]HPH92453.1 LytTR family DNA-binding domain-containing protein [Ferruginibacter sp.]
MQVIIIEDEMMTAEDLAAILLKLPCNVHISKILCSVKEALLYLKTNPVVDLIFCDIQLGDGHCFEIFKQVRVAAPVIFCTAYNEYALDAFNNNGIGYVLKPFSKKSIKDEVDKFIAFKSNLVKMDADLSSLLHTIQTKNVQGNKPSCVLVSWKDKIVPVKFADVALFGIEFKTTKLLTKDNRNYTIMYNLEELEEMCGNQFYRANRQYLINKSAIKEVQQFTARKLFVKLSIDGEYDITIAKAKVPEFLSWLKN